MLRRLLAGAALALLAGSAASAQERTTDQALRFYQSRVAADADDPLAHNRLATAYIGKARESGDLTYYGLAEQAARRSLELVARGPGAAAAHTLLAAVHVARHEFKEALGQARTALDLNPADRASQAIAGDALVELGDYDGAARTYARLASRTGPHGADSRIAWLKFLQGESSAAVASMREAAGRTAAANPLGEPTAWTHTQLGGLLFQTGDLAGAAAACRAALAALPGYHAALAGTARVQAARGQFREAALLYRKALDVVPLPEYAAALGDVYTRLGRPQDALKQYALVEYIGRLSALNRVVYNRELALFLADHDRRLPEALELARKELDARRDVYTYDVLAWALHKNGRGREAKAAMTEALRLGTPDARLLFHAGMIHRALGEHGPARAALGRALALNPQFHVLHAGVAAGVLAELDARR